MDIAIKVTTYKTYRGVEITTDSQTNQAVGEALMYTGPTYFDALSSLFKTLKSKSIEIGSISLAGSNTLGSAQQDAYSSYKAAGGKLPLHLYLYG